MQFAIQLEENSMLLMKKSRLYDSPFKLLRERYARGEINDEEYTHQSKILSNKP